MIAPLRWLSRHCRQARQRLTAAPRALQAYGGARLALARARRLYRTDGLAGFRRKLFAAGLQLRTRPTENSAGRDRNDYQAWLRRYDTLDDQQRRHLAAEIAAWPSPPRLSVLMPVCDPPPDFLEAALASVRNQLYPHWELCIADDASQNPVVRDLLDRHAAADPRIKLLHRQVNGHVAVASNTALELATGDFVALLDHDDLLAETALYWVARTILANPAAGLLYSDEDKISAAGTRHAPHFKCRYNQELLLAQNMISHLGVYRRTLLSQLGGFRPGFDGAQDYDLALRAVERLDPARIVHIPRILYHWRAIPGSTALAAGEKGYAAAAGRRAVAEHLQRTGIAATVLAAPEAPECNRIHFHLPVPAPLVTVVIPTRDRADLLATCVTSLLQRTDYPAFELLIVDNASVEPRTAALLNGLPPERVRILRDDAPFNFSRLVNRGVQAAAGEFVCLLNNDIEVLTPAWLTEMVACACRPRVGCVGARLWYPDGTLQHGGIILGVGGVAGHAHKYLPRGATGYARRAVLQQSLCAVTAACLLVRRRLYLEVGGFDETQEVAFNDVDFCLRVHKAGYRNLWTPYAELIHHESASRGSDDTPPRRERFMCEVLRMQARWGAQLTDDPAYSPNLTLRHEDFSLAWPPRGDAAPLNAVLPPAAAESAP